MKLARFWAKELGQSAGITARSRGWSNESLEEATARARDNARKIAAAIAAGNTLRNQYFYAQRPLPEPVLQQFQNEAGDLVAAITRNSYGALVLNTQEMMFIDVDQEEIAPTPAGGLISGLFSLFGKPAPRAAEGPVEKAQRLAQQRSLSLRAYKTAAGFRFLITSRAFDGASTESEALLSQFGSDPLYIRLCRSQECFRARLTPKPWRCNLPQPPVSFPFTTDRERDLFGQWERRYSSAIARFATCQYLGLYGGNATASRFQALIDSHDETTRAKSGLPLA